MSDSTTSNRAALAFAYDGTAFDSFARQPRRRTVEGELLGSLQRLGAVGSTKPARFEVASRTDKGVSALWNVCALDSTMDLRALVHGLRTPPGLHVLAGARVQAGFSPRREAAWRRYAYHLEAPVNLDASLLRRAARLFVGRHDFAAFCRPEPGVGTVRTVDRAVAARSGAGWSLRFTAQSFLWEQVRRMVTAVVSVADGARSLQSLQAQLAAARRVGAERPSAPEPLVLEAVEVPVEWSVRNRAAGREVRAESAAASSRQRFYEGLVSSIPTERR